MNRWFFWVLAPVMLGTAVLVAYSLYVGSEAWLWWNGKPLGLLSSKSESNLMNAIGGFISFGLPSIVFLLKGRSETAVDALLSNDEPETEDHM